VFQRFMQGRYGLDSFTVFLLVCAFVLTVFHIVYLLIVAYLLMIYAVFRILSRNLARRAAEQQAFLRFANHIRPFLYKLSNLFSSAVKAVTRFFGGLGARIAQRKDHVFIRCPQCKNLLRLPRIKGKLSVTCPVCRNRFTHGR